MVTSLFRLAYQNLQVKHLRFYIILVSVSIVVGALFASAILIMGIHHSLDKGLSKLGADLLVIPKESLVNMKSALLTGEPSAFYMDSSVLAKIRSLKGVKKVSGQIFLTSATGDCCVMGNSFLIGFNPEDDFTVLPWVEKSVKEGFPADGAIVGAMTPWNLGDSIKFYNVRLNVWAKLERTGIGLYDNAVFFHINRAYEMSENSQTDPSVKPLAHLKNKISGGLVQLAVGAKIPYITFSILKDNPTLKVVTTGNIQTSARQTTIAVFFGIIALIALLILSNILMINAIFSAVVNERKREIGIIRAVGAAKRDIFKLILYESTLISVISGFVGMLVGGFLLRLFQRSIVFYLRLLNIPFMLPPYDVIALMTLGAIGVALLMGISGSMYPALLAVRIDPHETMKQGL
ncbi:MAG: FtsX-like permease family protein [Nitrospirae bacterium]|nr:FtsX-like permease family protein [Nitrospirota bacterium]